MAPSAVLFESFDEPTEKASLGAGSCNTSPELAHLPSSSRADLSPEPSTGHGIQLAFHRVVL